MPKCCEFCDRLGQIRLQDGQLLTHDSLVADLGFDDVTMVTGQLLGTWSELRESPENTFCRLVFKALDARLGLGDFDLDDSSLAKPISVLILPGERCLRLSYPSRLGLRFEFVAKDASHTGGPDIARPVDLSGGVDTTRIQEWLRICDEGHEECSLDYDTHNHTVHFQHIQDNSSPDFPDDSFPSPPKFIDPHERKSWFGIERRSRGIYPSSFRVIDLELGCITPAALDAKHVALSYVWGEARVFRLERANFKWLSKPGSLESIRPELPRTIADAMTLVTRLGLRYLWVDSLCLIQDDPVDVAQGIQMMNSIYRNAYFTIVAAAGTHADTPLPNLISRDGEQVIGLVSSDEGGLEMCATTSIDLELRNALYNTRGWTLQELVLTRRAVIFSRDQVHFRCQAANFSEASWAGSGASTHRWVDPDDSNISRMPDPGAGFLAALWAYQKLMEDYSARTIRNDGDALRAAVGITRPLAAGMQTDLVEGLPGYYLDHFLLFISADGNFRRRKGFASYSWAGWQGRVGWPRENFAWFGGEGEEGGRVWATENILKHFRYRRLVGWTSLDMRGYNQSLSSDHYWISPQLRNLMDRFPAAFPPDKSEEGKTRTGVHDSTWRYRTSSGSHGDMPYWENDNTEILRQGSSTGFALKQWDLVDSEADFDRMLRRTRDTREYLTMANWIACRWLSRTLSPVYSLTYNIGHSTLTKIHTSGAQEIKKTVEASRTRSSSSRPLRTRRSVLDDETTLRGPPEAYPVDLDARQTRDARVKSGVRWLNEKNGIKHPKPSDLPNFPPYTILVFDTISVHLILGVSLPTKMEELSATTTIPTGRVPSRPQPHQRIPGVPILSTTEQLVGSLHPDNTSDLPVAGTAIELIVICRSSEPTASSVLLGNDGDGYAQRKWDLLWVLYVIWKEGIAYRRGVGQIMTEALGMGRGLPDLKTVLLG